MMRKPSDNADSAARVAAWVRDRFALPGDAVVLAAELNCQTPGCPPVETAIAFWMAPAPRYRIRIFKPLAAVEDADLPPRWLLPGLVDEGEDCC